MHQQGERTLFHCRPLRIANLSLRKVGVTRLTSSIAPLLYRHFSKQGRLYMRKLILISALVLASVSVQAVEARELILAASDAPAAAAPVPATVTPAAATATPAAATATPAAPAATADTAPPQASRKQASRSKDTLVRRETNEQKARLIAARYGISW
jgi:hypothetical protein